MVIWDSINKYISYNGGWFAIANIIIIIIYGFILKKVQNNTDKKIENIKGYIQKENSVLSNSFYIHQKFVEKQIECLDLLWKSVLQISKIVSPYNLSFAILTDEEIENKKFIRIFDINSYKTKETEIIEEINKIQETMEQIQPYIGLKLFWLVFVYKVVVLRSIYLLTKTADTDKVIVWHKDTAIMDLIDKLYFSEKDKNEIKNIIDRKLGTLENLLKKIKADILQEIYFIMKGEKSVIENMEIYKNFLLYLKEIKFS